MITCAYKNGQPEFLTEVGKFYAGNREKEQEPDRPRTTNVAGREYRQELDNRSQVPPQS